MIKRRIYIAALLSAVFISVLSFNNCGEVRFRTSVNKNSLGSLGNDFLITNTNKITIEGKCDTRSSTVTISGPESKSAICQATAASGLAGQFSFETNEYDTDEARVFNFAQTIEGETINNKFTWHRDTEPPVVSNTIINGGKKETGRPVINVQSQFTDNMDFLRPSTHIQIQEANLTNGDCKSQFNEKAWGNYSGPTESYGALVSFFTGNKKICIWAKDFAGNISKLTNESGTDNIFLNVGNIPTFSSLSVENSTTEAGVYTAQKDDSIEINYSVEDKEGLAKNPVDIFYTLNGKTWTSLAKDQGASPEGAKKLTGTYNFQAPSDNFFRIMLVARDKASNTSYETLSQPFNSGDWTLFAGNNNRGIGQSALSLSLTRNGAASNSFAVDPQSLDIYAIDQRSGLIHIDSRTGLTKILIRNGRTHLPENGPLKEEHKIHSNYTSIKFSNTSKELVISTLGKGLSTSIQSQFIYFLDTKTNTIRKVAGGGLENDGAKSPLSLFLMSGNFALDESDSLYIHTSCTPGYWNRNNLPEYRLLKIVNENGVYNKVERIAGGCHPKMGRIEFGKEAFDNHYNRYQYANSLTDIAVWDNGNSIYISSHGGSKTFKIISGIIYQTEIPSINGGLLYSSTNKKLYIANNQITEVTPNLEGNKGESYKIIVAQKEGPGCTKDGQLATQSCVITSMVTGLTQTPQGHLFFADGVNVNRPGYYRIRFLSPDQKVYSMAGHLPFYGDNQHKSVIRSNFAGIHYKPKNSPNQKTFPAGLYFVDKDAAVFGYIDPNTQKAKILAGNQSRLKGVSQHTKAKPMSNLNTMGYTYSGGSMFPLAFDKDGLPWMRTETFVTHINKNRIVNIFDSAKIEQQFVRQGNKAKNVSMWPFGGRSVFETSGKGLFLMGAYDNGIITTRFYNAKPVISYLDYASNKVTHVMGGTGRTTSYDSKHPGGVATKSLNKACNNSQCSAYYDEAADILYFSEMKRIRAIKNPKDPAKAFLATLNLPLLTEKPNASYKSFTLSKDRTRIYVIVGGRLKCYNLKGTSNLCDGKILGPTKGLGSIGHTANQLSWKSDNELLISTLQGTVLLYKVPKE